MMENMNLILICYTDILLLDQQQLNFILVQKVVSTNLYILCALKIRTQQKVQVIFF